MMKQLGIVTLVLCTAIGIPIRARGQQQQSAPDSPISTKIVRNSTVYIEPMEGFESYLAAAFQKKKVQLVPVADKDKADYIITGTSEDKKAGWAKMVVFGNIHSNAAASISMVATKSAALA